MSAGGSVNYTEHRLTGREQDPDVDDSLAVQIEFGSRIAHEDNLPELVLLIVVHAKEGHGASASGRKEAAVGYHLTRRFLCCC